MTNPATPIILVPAHELRMGDIVVNPEDGEREHAVFDLDVLGDGRVTIWPAAPDRALGWPREFTVPASTVFHVRRIS